MILGPRFCGREDVWKGWRTIALYLRFSKQGACCVYYQNIVDFLFRVVKVCLCIYLILWKLSESFREIVNFPLCLFDDFLLGILALLVSEVEFYSCLLSVCQVLQGAWRYFMGFGGVHAGGGGSAWLGRAIQLLEYQILWDGGLI